MRIQPSLLARRGILPALLAVVVSLGAASCAKVPLMGGKPAVVITLTSLPTANACGDKTGNSLNFRVLQVTDASALTGASLTQLWDREDKLLGGALLSKQEGFIDPGLTQEFKYERDPKTKAVVFVGSFCRPQGNCWYYVRPLASGAKLKLTINESCATETRKK